MAVTSVRIERDRLEAFKRVAAANRRSVSQQMRWLMDQCIEDHDDNDQEPLGRLGQAA